MNMAPIDALAATIMVDVKLLPSRCVGVVWVRMGEYVYMYMCNRTHLLDTNTIVNYNCT